MKYGRLSKWSKLLTEKKDDRFIVTQETNPIYSKIINIHKEENGKKKKIYKAINAKQMFELRQRNSGSFLLTKG